MAEARTGEEEEDMRGENRRQSGGRPDRRKPEQRHSQGPLSSIRAAIKRTSARPASVSEPARDRERERRRPEITVLSAEPLASTSWFPGASGGFPPPPPPAAQIWGAAIPPAIQPPPSYEEVIREKTQEQVRPSPAPPPSSSSTIATQTDAGSASVPPESPAQPPVRPPRPPVASGPLRVGAATPDQSPPPPLTPPRPKTVPAPCRDLLGDLDSPDAAAPGPPADPAPPERPRPRPRTKLAVRPAGGGDVRVQTLVKLREDGAATLAAAAAAARTGSDAQRGRYLQELLDAFSADDWGFPDRHGDSSGQSESEEEEEDMATLRARIQAFEQQAGGGSGGAAEDPPNPPAAKPRPRPRPRLRGQPARSAPPAIAPKPKHLPSATRPASKAFWEDGGKPPVTPKPQLALDAPVPAPRPPPPKAPAPASDSASNPKAPAPATDSASNPKPPAPASDSASNPKAPAPATDSASNPKPPAPASDSASNPKAPAPATDSASNPKAPPRPSVAPRASVSVSPAAAAAATGSEDSRSDPDVAPAPASRRGPPRAQTPNMEPDTATPARSSSVKLLPLRPPPIKSNPGRPPPPAFSSAPSTNQTAALSKPADAPPASRASPPRSSPTANQKAAKRGPPLPPRPQPGHPLYSATKQEVLIVLDDPSPAPSDHPPPADGGRRTAVVEGPLDPDPALDRDGQSKAALEGLGPSDSQSILPAQPGDQKEPPEPPVSGPRCVATLDRDGEEEDELTFGQPPDGAAPETPPATDSKVAEEWDAAVFDFPGQTAEDLSFLKGALIRVTERVDAEWRRGRLDGREGLYPVAFTRPWHAQPIRSREAKAAFDFTAENDDELNVKVGDIITQVEVVDEQWIVGVVGGKRGIVPKNYISLA